MSDSQKLTRLIELVEQLRDTVAEQGEQIASLQGEKRIPLADAAKRLGFAPPTLRRKVQLGLIECCARRLPKPNADKGDRGGPIFFLERHLREFNEGKRRSRRASA